MAAKERHLLSRHLEGDAGAFEELLGAYRAPVYAYLVRCGIPGDVRDDLFQEIFLRIHRGAASYAPDRELKPWIFTIAANTVRSHFRKAKVRSIEQSQPEVVEQMEDGEPDGEAVAEARETARFVEEAMKALPVEQREVLILAGVERMSMKEIAEALEKPVNTVKTTLRRARMTLAGKLARRELRAKREMA